LLIQKEVSAYKFVEAPVSLHKIAGLWFLNSFFGYLTKLGMYFMIKWTCPWRSFPPV
jgi:hypothetical protein